MITFALTCILISLILTAYRVLKGPSWADRIMALDFLTVNLAALVVVLGIKTGYESFLDIALLVSLLGFLTTVAFTRYLLERKVLK